MTETWDAVARHVLDQARRSAGGGVALAAALKAANVGPDSGAYSASAVSNWIKGRTRPPADVVLAAATLYGLSLDAALGIAPPTVTSSEGDELQQLRTSLTSLETLVHQRLSSQEDADAPSVKDVRAAFATRSEVQTAFPVLRTLATAESVDAMGLSLNTICQGVSDVTLTELVENGLVLRCLLLEPDGEATAAREAEEGHPAGHLADLTRTNLHALARVRRNLSTEARSRLQIRVYDATIRFNITTFDQARSLVQLYLPGLRGVDSPTLVIEADDREPHGIFPVFERIWTTTWERAHDVTD